MKIGINGGLGNQLFQVSFAHREMDSIIELYLDSAPRLDRPFELKDFSNFCEHISKIESMGNRFVKFRIKFMRLPMKLKLYFLSDFFSYFSKITFEKFPFSSNTGFVKENNLHLGYFQHWILVEQNWIHFGPELQSSLTNIDGTAWADIDFSSTIVIHVRQGDLINVKNTMGILSSEYYKKAVSVIQVEAGIKEFKLVVVTDDKKRVAELNYDLAISRIYGPDELTAWETLKLMSESRYLVCANSTLSWWGSYLSAKNQGFVVLPNPWFKNWHENVGEAFLFPGSNPIESRFA